MLRGNGCGRSVVRALLLVALLTAMTLAGCLGDDAAPAATDEDGTQEAADPAGDTDAQAGAGSGDPPSGGSGSEPEPEPEPGTSPPANQSTSSPLFVSRTNTEITWSGCREYTMRMPTTAAAFADEVPEGFEIVTTDAAGLSTDIVVWWRLCPAIEVSNTPAPSEPAPYHGEMWTAVPVTVPDGLVAESADADYWALTWGVDSAQVLENYQAWGMSGFAIAGLTEYTPTVDGGAVVVDGVEMENDAARYRFALALAYTGNGPTPGTERVWVPGEGGTLGAVWTQRGEGANGAEGGGSVRQTGDNNFPTVFPVRTASTATDVEVTTRFLPLV